MSAYKEGLAAVRPEDRAAYQRECIRQGLNARSDAEPASDAIQSAAQAVVAPLVAELAARKAQAGDQVAAPTGAGGLTDGQ